MATVQISKIQLRRGRESDLPGATLDEGELGFTTDTGRLFIGQLGSPSSGVLLNQANTVELLTPNTPPAALQPLYRDNNFGFFISVAMTSGGPHALQTLDPSMVARDFHLDLPVSGANCTISYYVFAADRTAMRQGVINVVWTSTMVSPTLVDTPVTGVGVAGDLTWTAVWDGTHVLLKYTNATGDTPTVYFRIDRPIVA